MASTGEVGCIGSDTSCAVLKAMLSVGYRIPKKKILLSTGTPKQKVDMLEAARMLQKKGFQQVPYREWCGEHPCLLAQ